MGLKKTLHWAKTEWGIFSSAGGMTVRDQARWLRQWVPFGARTVGYGSLSLLLGPLTRDRRASQWAARRWSRASMKALSIPVEIDGLDRIPEGSVVYACNHQSLIDILVLGAVLPGDFKWATKRSVMNVPFLGWHLRLAGHVPVDRKRDRSTAMAAVDRFERVLGQGKRLLVFPEGTRSEDGTIKAFKDGGFYAAVRAQRPVVPVALEGTYRLMGKHAVHSGEMDDPQRRLVRLQVGSPLVAKDEGEELERVEDLRERTRQVVLSMHRELLACR